MNPVRKYSAQLHGQLVTVNVYPPSPEAQPSATGWAKPRLVGAAYYSIPVDWTYQASPSVPRPARVVNMSDCEE